MKIKVVKKTAKKGDVLFDPPAGCPYLVG